jgi:hypothetical protein
VGQNRLKHEGTGAGPPKARDRGGGARCRACKLFS